MMNRSLLPPLWQQLRWKLAWSYTIVTVSAIILAGFLLAVFFAVTIAPERFANFLDVFMLETAPTLAPLLEQSSSESEALQRWLQSLVFESTIRRADTSHKSWHFDLSPARITFAAFVDKDTHIIAVEPQSACEPLTTTCLPYEITPYLDVVLTDYESQPAHIVLADQVVLLYPIRRIPEAEVVGALVIGIAWPQHIIGRVRVLLAPFARSILLVIALTAVLGTIFGYWTARTLTRRLDALGDVTRAWQSGDFTVMIHDESPDELGILARRLNEMAVEWQQVLRTREMLAMFEERQRVARDLHDAVKQKLFSVGMQLGIARTLLETNPTHAKNALDKAQHLLRDAQEELTALIHELRPLVLRSQSFPEAVYTYVQNWAYRTGIAVDIDVSPIPVLSQVYQLNLFRVLQEALNNVERHSQAQQVRIRLGVENNILSLYIEDDGRGFDASVVLPRGEGLLNMRERIEMLGGAWSCESVVRRGTVLKIHVPLQEEGEEG